MDGHMSLPNGMGPAVLAGGEPGYWRRPTNLRRSTGGIPSPAHPGTSTFRPELRPREMSRFDDAACPLANIGSAWRLMVALVAASCSAIGSSMTSKTRSGSAGECSPSFRRSRRA